jgi:nucleotide-binding universal stress UspA family protein
MSLFPRSILLATDGSNEAELAAGVAVELARGSGAELHLVHVKLLPITPPYPEVLDWRDDLERADREARELLDEQVKKVEEAGGAVAGIHSREGRPPAEEVVGLAEELGAYLIVVGRRNRGRIRRVLAGTISDWVVRHAHSPVLVVPQIRTPISVHVLSAGLGPVCYSSGCRNARRVHRHLLPVELVSSSQTIQESTSHANAHQPDR